MSELSFYLSHDELAWLLVQLRIPPRLGMGETLYPAGSEPAVVEARLAAGAQALRARGFVQIDSAGKLIVGEVPLAALGATALARAAALATVQQGEDEQVYGCYFADSLLVEHQLPVDGLHRFTLANTWDEMVALMLDHLQLSGLTPLPLNPIRLSSDAVGAVLEAAAGSAAAARHELEAVGVRDETLPGLLSGWTTRIAIAMMSSDPDSAPAGDPRESVSPLGNLLVFTGTPGAVCFEYVPDAQGGTEYVALKPYSPDAARADLKRLAYSLPFLGGRTT